MSVFMFGVHPRVPSSTVCLDGRLGTNRHYHPVGWAQPTGFGRRWRYRVDAPDAFNYRGYCSNFWSASPNANNSNNVWVVNFNNGNDNNNNRNNDKYVWLVRGGEWI